MGMYIEIEGAYPCAKCGKPLAGWQSKELRQHGEPIDPAAWIGETVALARGMDGEIHNGHDDPRCDYYTEYTVTDGTIGDPKDRRMGWDAPLPGSHTIPADSPLAHMLAEARGKPVVAVANGVRYTLVPEDPFAFYDPQRVRAAVEQSAGAFKRAGVDGEQLLRDLDRDRGLRYRDVREMIREAKPTPLPTEYGAETRYGRESHANSRYNDALDDYERALLDRLDRHEAGE